MHSGILRLAAFAVTLVCPATAQVATLHIQVIEGEGAVHPPGSRSAQPLTVQVTDEIGRPVAGAAVTFQLPEDGPGGSVGRGLRSDVATTDAQGRVALRGMQVNRIAGRFAVRIVASKEQARAGMISTQFIGTTASASRVRARWVVLAALVGGGVAAGVLCGGRGAATVAAPPSVPPPAAATAVSIGSPTSTVGRP